MTAYVELQLLTHFSLLRGASSPEELFSAAALLGYPALGVCDLGTVAGVVRAWEAQKATGVRLIAGACVLLSCGRELLLYPTDQPGRACSPSASAGRGEGGCLLHWPNLEAWSEGLIAILVPDAADAGNAAALADLKAVYGRRSHGAGPSDAAGRCCMIRAFRKAALAVPALVAFLPAPVGAAGFYLQEQSELALNFRHLRPCQAALALFGPVLEAERTAEAE